MPPSRTESTLGVTAPRSGHRVESRRSEAQDGRQKALEKRCIWPLVGTFEHENCLLNSYG